MYIPEIEKSISVTEFLTIWFLYHRFLSGTVHIKDLSGTVIVKCGFRYWKDSLRFSICCI